MSGNFPAGWHHCVESSRRMRVEAWLGLVSDRADRSRHTHISTAELPSGRLELPILHGVDDRVYGAVEENTDYRKVVVSATEIRRIAKVHHKVIYLVLGPTKDESCRYHG